MERTVRAGQIFVLQVPDRYGVLAIRMRQTVDWLTVMAKFRDWLRKSPLDSQARQAYERLTNPNREEDEDIDLRLELNGLLAQYLLDRGVAESIDDRPPLQIYALLNAEGLQGFAMRDLWRV